ncbi:MAG TPA: DUF2089 domain-containing protein [Mycobacteriales bacterium]|nr:DUF2089 domain-containing protein [Mycobacteriales bacterium]
MSAAPYPSPKVCPTCQAPLTVSGLHCHECGTDVHGNFRRCEFCSLDDDQRDLLRVFLAARGNAKELERHLGVSYPTARSRLDKILAALGISDPPPPRPASRRDVLDALAEGRIDVDTALNQIDHRS